MTKQEYFLINFIEELSEVIQATSKVLRFTANNKYELYEKTNLENLKLEFVDLMALVEILNGLFHLGLWTSDDEIQKAIDKKVNMYERAKALGTVNDVDN